MSYFQNLFNDYYGYYTAGDSSSFKLTFKVPANKNHGEFFINWNTGPYNFDSFGSNLTFNFAFDPSFKNWSSFTVDVAGADSSATTVYEIVDILNNDSNFKEWYTAGIHNNNQIGIRQKRPAIQFHTYISNSEAEFVLKFNKNAGIADVPSYFDKDTIDNRFTSQIAHGHLIRLGKTIVSNTASESTAVTVINHGLSNGDTIYIVNSNSIPSIDGSYNVTVTGTNEFVIDASVAVAGTSGEMLTGNDYQVLVDAGIDYTKMLSDYEHLQGRCEAFKFTKNTLDSSSRIVSQIVYAAGATAGMLGKKTTYTYLSSNTTPDSVSEIPYVLTSEDLVIETPAPTPPGRLFNWGRNDSGQLGKNDVDNRSSPVQTIAYGIDWKQVKAGSGFSMAIKDNGTLWAWGDNYSGQLGDGTTDNKSSPIQVGSDTNWSSISCGDYHTAAIKTDGTLWIWGSNYNYQLGTNNGYSVWESSPVQTSIGGNDWVSVSCGYGHTVALKSNGTMWTWGNGYYGQLGDDQTDTRSYPVMNNYGEDTWSKIYAGYNCTFGIKNDGTLWSFGLNDNGTLGDGTDQNRSSLVQVLGSGLWKQVDVKQTAIAIKQDGTLWTWGYGSSGRLGNNDVINYSSPIQTVMGGNGWVQCSAGGTLSAAIRNDGTLWTWGENLYGQLGNGTYGTEYNTSSPVQVTGINWAYVACGSGATSAIKSV
jgi:alpha-tubulin suppressor-like RCC1 family protein